jgi:hypothetical protein
VAHGNWGLQPVHAISEHVCRSVVESVLTTYTHCNDSHLTELLTVREKIVVSCSSVRRIRRIQASSAPVNFANQRTGCGAHGGQQLETRSKLMARIISGLDPSVRGPCATLTPPA